jgi:hypothetical protein
MNRLMKLDISAVALIEREIYLEGLLSRIFGDLRGVLVKRHA